ncbi:MAG: response regulator [Anaerolineales bacterium]|nr:response regulator [Anaerolineales bacterium]
MSEQRILLVEDHNDVRRMLRSGLESLNKDMVIMDVPSGEEGLLLASRQDFDLMIADVRLAGISGLELFRKVRQRNPHIKVIIITGVVDQEIRQSVVQSGVNAYFFKPVPMPEFLETVSHYLGFSEAPALGEGTPQAPVSIDKPTTGLLDWLEKIRLRIEAKSMILLSRMGQVFIQSGELPDSSILPSLIPFVMVSLNLSERVSNIIESRYPEDLSYFGGGKYNVFIAHVGAHFALVVLTEAPSNPGLLGLTLQQLPVVVAELKKLIVGGQQPTEVPELPAEAPTPPPPAPSKPKPAQEPAVESAPLPAAETTPAFKSESDAESEFDDIFSGQSADELNPRQVDDFWNNLVNDMTPADEAFTDAFSYDEARRMGLTPEEEK